MTKQQEFVRILLRPHQQLRCGVIALCAVLLSSACAAAETMTTCQSIDAEQRLQSLISGDGPDRAPAAALAVFKDNTPLFKSAAGCAQFSPDGRHCDVSMTPATKFRAASISKMAAAFTALSLAEKNIVDLDKDVSEYLGYALRNPAFPGVEISLRHLLSHTSTLRDPEEYWLAAPGIFRDHLAEQDTLFSSEDGPPGSYFTYSNINFGVITGVLEMAAGERFDRLVQSEVADPLGLDIGFNWAGVSPEARRNAATLYRLIDEEWIAQTDGSEILDQQGPYFLAQSDVDRRSYLEGYAPGDNPTLFSPQGGLRASVLDLARLVQELRPGARFETAALSQWRHQAKPENGDTLNGLMTSYGLGTHEISGLLTRGQRLFGHSGEAYGLFSGAWILENSPYAIAYAVTGSPETVTRGDHSGLTKTEETLVEAAFDIIQACGE